jgi:lysophospholipase L1-like esterase
MKLLKSKKFWIGVGVSGLGIVVASELFARLVLGLGSPPLSMSHPTIEYMFKPNQDVYRFGNRFIVNQYGMRTEPFEQNLSSNRQLRVMIFGDSVLNGGNLTDHRSLATTILARTWEDKFETDVIVGNISAGSWGPGNWLGYAKEYGFFDANAIIVVLSSHDFNDNPNFKPLNPDTHPQNPPILAIFEGITRYLPRYLPDFGSSSSQPAKTNRTKEATSQGIDDLSAFLKLAQQKTSHVFVFQYPSRQEAETGQKEEGYAQIRDLCTKLDVPVFSMHSTFHSSLQKGKELYRPNDPIHPNEAGQKLIADEIRKNIPDQALQPTQSTRSQNSTDMGKL